MPCSGASILLAGVLLCFPACLAEPLRPCAAAAGHRGLIRTAGKSPDQFVEAVACARGHVEVPSRSSTAGHADGMSKPRYPVIRPPQPPSLHLADRSDPYASSTTSSNSSKQHHTASARAVPARGRRGVWLDSNDEHHGYKADVKAAPLDPLHSPRGLATRVFPAWNHRGTRLEELEAAYGFLSLHRPGKVYRINSPDRSYWSEPISHHSLNQVSAITRSPEEQGHGTGTRARSQPLGALPGPSEGLDGVRLLDQPDSIFPAPNLASICLRIHAPAE
ncbi:uncharacterized protein B0I36DRAFT_349057 [Microdochium trichocladiopsis]|uniref:Uncharacterized protein n=1 Tax=Microdochium trichocladiopsis TaxID=1682393 RepID=A0A9P8Y8T3_9PEZI|nr:uncharacterized protein B0I36DRAFT_349057 [Microdochium trichocladiopsis]KAH7030884.1 hypothetical protein B0I36DRAFT_349057 [Microdochium trichocladiopsis]